MELLANRLTQLPAHVCGFADRGVLAPGMHAGMNVFDLGRLGVELPRRADDFPSGAERFLQDARGVVMTIVNGVHTRRDDRDAGARPGRILRNPRWSVHAA